MFYYETVYLKRIENTKILKNRYASPLRSWSKLRTAPEMAREIPQDRRG